MNPVGRLFNKQVNLILRGVFVLIGVAIVASAVIAFEVVRAPWETEVSSVQDQVVPFSHKHHVGGLGIDCRFCHASVSTSANAGMPSSKVCMTCHSQIWKDASLLKPVRESFEKGVALEWNKVYRLPHYVYFDHSIHVNKGIGCVSCHGPIDQMPMTMKYRTFYMRDCLECHSNPEKYLRPQEKIYDLNWPAPEDQLHMGQQLVEKNHIEKYRLKDCNTCHR